MDHRDGVSHYFFAAGSRQFHRHHYPAPGSGNDLDAAAVFCLGAVRDRLSVAARIPSPGGGGGHAING